MAVSSPFKAAAKPADPIAFIDLKAQQERIRRLREFNPHVSA